MAIIKNLISIKSNEKNGFLINKSYDEFSSNILYSKSESQKERIWKLPTIQDSHTHTGSAHLVFTRVLTIEILNLPILIRQLYHIIFLFFTRVLTIEILNLPIEIMQ
ncbi:hypothetical protein ACTFIR_012175 [Dictyostelium discoideum]